VDPFESGRIRSIHCKGLVTRTGRGYTVLFGEGFRLLEEDFRSAESVGGGGLNTTHLVEQEHPLSEIETARACLKAFVELPPEETV